MDREALLAEMRAARRELMAAIRGLDPHTVITEEGWRLHDILGHIASWDREALAAAQAFLAGDRPYTIPDYDGIHAWNERQVRRKADWPAEQVRMDFVMVRVELEHLLAQFDEDHLQRSLLLPWGEVGTLYDLFYLTCVEHDREHLDTIRAWRLQHLNGGGQP
ncbi:MAG: ClbS/DfsB family four-helix bundle protein [Ardenticatenia bacterium]|nr:ClbS/DfsB family four-helix bundle protein [Ardenticatenia bacterium]